MANIQLVGGTEADRDTILRLHADYLDANTGFDWQQVATVFSEREDAEFFNMNGFTYKGLAHWTRLWKYYATQVQSTYWSPYDIAGVVDAHTAIVWCHRSCQRSWVGDDTPVKDIHYDNSKFMSRSTMVFLKQDDVWRVLHAHFSKGEDGPRPGGI